MPAALSALSTSPLAFLDGIGGMEMLLVFVIGLLLYFLLAAGGKKTVVEIVTVPDTVADASSVTTCVVDAVSDATLAVLLAE
jgi:hypothetical protein